MKNAAIYLILTLSLPLADSAIAENSKPASATSDQPEHKQGKATVRRRVVPREVERRAVPPSPAAIPLPQTAPPATTQQPKPAAPAPITNCDPGGCRDAGGNRYNGATGNTYLDNNGKPCNRSGTWVQCF